MSPLVGAPSANAGVQAYRQEISAQKASLFAKTGLSASELKNLATLIRQVLNDETGQSLFQITNAADPAPNFKCALLPPKAASTPAADAAPRASANRSVMYWMAKNIKGQAQPAYTAGARFDVDGMSYELVSGSRALRIAQRIHAYHAEVLPVVTLWPLTAQLQELGGVVVEANVPVAIWEGAGEVQRGRGMYDDIEAEAPPEFLAELEHRNRQLVLGGYTYRIKSALPHFQQPHVQMRLTRNVST